MGGLVRRQVWDPTKIPARKNNEARIQLSACKHVRQYYPNVIFYCDTGSGAKMTKATAVQSARMRWKKGHPDMNILAQRHGYAGLFIEIKDDGVKLKRTADARKILKGEYVLRRAGDWWDEHVESQAEYHEALKKAGYYADFAVGLDEVLKIIDWYLGGTPVLNDPSTF